MTVELMHPDFMNPNDAESSSRNGKAAQMNINGPECIILSLKRIISHVRYMGKRLYILLQVGKYGLGRIPAAV